MPPTGHAGSDADARYVSPASASSEVPALMDSCTHNTGSVFGTICVKNTRTELAPDHNADSTYAEHAASSAEGRRMRARFSPYAQPQAAMTTAADARTARKESMR